MAQRPYDRGERTSRWRAHVEKQGSYEINIHAWTDDRTKAQQIENELIAAHSPSCNIKKIDRRVFHPTPPKPPSHFVPPAEVKAALERLAKADDRTLSYIINKIVADYLRAKKLIK
jgi:hypothetical protein